MSVDIVVDLTRDEILVSSVIFQELFRTIQMFLSFLFVLYHLESSTATTSIKSNWVGEGSSVLQFGFRGVGPCCLGICTDLGRRQFSLCRSGCFGQFLK